MIVIFCPSLMFFYISALLTVFLEIAVKIGYSLVG